MNFDSISHIMFKALHTRSDSLVLNETQIKDFELFDAVIEATTYDGRVDIFGANLDLLVVYDRNHVINNVYYAEQIEKRFKNEYPEYVFISVMHHTHKYLTRPTKDDIDFYHKVMCKNDFAITNVSLDRGIVMTTYRGQLHPSVVSTKVFYQYEGQSQFRTVVFGCSPIWLSHNPELEKVLLMKLADALAREGFASDVKIDPLKRVC